MAKSGLHQAFSLGECRRASPWGRTAGLTVGGAGDRETCGQPLRRGQRPAPNYGPVTLAEPGPATCVERGERASRRAAGLAEGKAAVPDSPFFGTLPPLRAPRLCVRHLFSGRG